MTPDSLVEKLENVQTSFVGDRWKDLSAALAPLWVGGAALAVLGLAYLLAPALSTLSPRAVAWAPYVALGTLFPGAIAASVVMAQTGRRLPAAVLTLLCIVPIAAAAGVAGLDHSILAVGLACVQFLICLAFASRHTRPTTAQALSLLVMAFVAWALLLEVLTWDILAGVLQPSLPLLIAAGFALIASCWWAFDWGSGTSGTRKPVATVIGILSLGILVLLAFRTDGLFTTDRLGLEGGTAYHWGAFVGAAEAVRQGGWLLWDVSSPYGFLTTLTLAAFPASTAYQSLYVLNAVAVALLAISVFWAIRSVQPGVLGAIFALAATVPIVFLVSNYPPGLIPEHYFPNAGPFRFGWSYVLVGLLLLERSATPGSRRQRVILIAGCLCWLLSALWSTESAFIGSAIWLPAFALIVLRDAGMFTGKRSWKAIAWLMVPPLLLAGAVGAIIVIYRLVLGHGPDARSYVENVMSFTGTRVRDMSGLFEGTEPNRTIALVMLAFLLLAMAVSATAVSLARWNDLPVLAGLAFGLWALASYPVGLPVPFAVFRLLPFMMLGLALVLGMFRPRHREQDVPFWVSLIRMGTIPLLAGALLAAYTDLAELQYYANAIRGEGFHGRDVTVGLPMAEPALADLLQQAGVAADDPIFYAGGLKGIAMPRWIPAGQTTPVAVSKRWLTGSVSGMVFLPEDRKRTYMQRHIAQQGEGGWLIERRDQENIQYGIGPWFFAQLNDTFAPTLVAENSDWRLVWYEPIDDVPSPRQRAPRLDRSPSFPPDLWINGNPLTGSLLPPVWGVFGPEWTEPTGRNAERCATDRATLNIYSASSLQGEIALVGTPDAPARRIAVAVDDGPGVAMNRTPSGKEIAPIALSAGWNVITITVDDQGTKTSGAANSCGPAGTADWPLRIRKIDLRI